jgi:hypothetical protein
MPLAEAGWYQEEMIIAVLDLERTDRGYVPDRLVAPPFLRCYWVNMVQAVQDRVGLKPT